MNNLIRIFVVSEIDEERERIIAALSSQNDFFIAGIEKEVSGAIIKTENLKPDVLILDSNLTGISGPELVPIIHRRSPSTAIILLDDREEESYVTMAFKAGISGFMLRKADINKLAAIVKIVHSGDYFISASIFIKVFIPNDKLFSEIQSTTQKYLKSFSPIERSVITHVARGLTDKEIARHLNYSAGTVKNCLTTIKRKTNLKSRVQIVLFSLVSGLVNMNNIDLLKTIDNLTIM
jgi:DNA-binding NarL/FixJ family response regulator